MVPTSLSTCLPGTHVFLYLPSCLPAVLQASAFIAFPDLASACKAVVSIKPTKAASAVELCDWASLTWVHFNQAGKGRNIARTANDNRVHIYFCLFPWEWCLYYIS